MIKITSLNKTYGQKTAIEEISLHIKSGICFGLIGPIKEMIGYVPQDICLEEKRAAN